MIHQKAIPPARARVLRFEATRDQILKAAREAVASEGWQGAHIALIAARARVATGSVYRYFESKADLFAQVLAHVSQREVDVVAAIANAQGPAPARLAAAVHTFMTRALERRRLAYALIAEPCEPEIDRARLIYRAALAREIGRIIEQGVKRREFGAVDACTAASCVTGAFMEALVGPLAPAVEAGSQAATAVIETTTRLCVRMVSPTSRPRGARRRR